MYVSLAIACLAVLFFMGLCAYLTIASEETYERIIAFVFWSILLISTSMLGGMIFITFKD